jgi:Putative sensor
MLPLGNIYFNIAFIGLAVSLTLMSTPFMYFLGYADYVQLFNTNLAEQPWLIIPMFIVGALGIFVTLHVARGVGKLHGQLAKNLLVQTSGTT